MRVAVVGSGYMGKGIAQVLARGGGSIVLADVDAARAEAAVADMLADVTQAEDAGLLPSGALEAVRARTGFAASIEDAVAAADYVVEAVPENLTIKHPVLRRIEAAARPEAIISSNTSAIPISVLAEVLQRPARFFGVHWFNPAPYVPSVEVIVGKDSNAALLDPVLELLKASGKFPALVADTPGFVCNRLQFALFREAAMMVEEGVATPESIDAVVRSSFGYRLPFFGPFAVADMAGLDVYAGSYLTLEKAYGDRFSCPPSLADRVAEGDLGIKSGGGYLGLDKDAAAALVRSRDRAYVALLDLRNRWERDNK